MLENNFDLNKIFQVNLTYNFDLLKSILEKIMKKQEETEAKLFKMKEIVPEQTEMRDKILILEKKFLNFQLTASENSPEKLKEIEEEKKKLEKQEEINNKKKELAKIPDLNEFSFSVPPKMGESTNNFASNLVTNNISSSQQKIAQPSTNLLQEETEIRNFSTLLEINESEGKDEITKKIIKKLNYLEYTISDVLKFVRQISEMKKLLLDNSKIYDVYEQKFLNMDKQNEEFKLKMERYDSIIKDLSSRINELNVADLFKDIQVGDDCKIAIGLISNLEKKLNGRIKFSDERFSKIEQDSIKIKTDCVNIVNNQDSINKKLPLITQDVKGLLTSKDEFNLKTEELEKINENMMNSLDENKNEMKTNYNEIISELNKLKEKIDAGLVAKSLKEEELESKKETPRSQIDEDRQRELKEIYKKIDNLDKIVKAISMTWNIDEIKENLKNLNDEIKTKSTIDELMDVKANFSKHIGDYTEMTDKIENMIEMDNKNNTELASIRTSVESIKMRINELRNQDNGNNNNLLRMQQFDSTKYVDYASFRNYQTQNSYEFRDMNHNLDKIKGLIDNIINDMKIKTTNKDLKNLEDDLGTKIEDLKSTCGKKFADKAETGKTLKYLDQQIKQIIEVYIKKMDKGDNWLLAKKPLGGHLCASCENYIGDLEDNNNYVLWNKLPIKDKEKQLYRIGNGFSKMLQMITVDGINGSGNENRNQLRSEENSKTFSNFHKEHFHPKNLPKIDYKNNNNEGFLDDEVDKANKVDEDPNQPRM